MKSKREIARSSRAMTDRMSFPRPTRESAPHITKGLAAILMALALVFAVTSCKTEPEDNPTYYTVTYSTEHATAPEKLTVTDGTALTAGQLPPLTESGYTFGGWYDGQTKAEAGYKVTKNVTLTAKWTVNTYTVTLNSNGSTNTITATYGKPLPDLAAIPTLEGSTFGGYYTEPYAKGKKFIDKDGKGITAWNLTEDTTLYAAWGYSITYKSTKDVQNTNPEIYTGGETVTLANLEKEGYTFNGWFDAETGGNKVESIAQGSTGAKTLYAQWTLITYTITYEGLDGATNPNTATTYTIETDDITLTDASKTGYTFGGWKNANGDAVTKITKGSTGDITLTAQWMTISYNITYEGLNGATNSNPVTYTIETATITLQSPARTGYTFNGWYDAETGGNKIESIAQGSTGAKTLYAQWMLITYTITYEGLNGAANPNTATSYTVESETITLQNPTRTGYIFTGWFDAETGGNKIESIAQGSTGAKTLYAQWTAISYEITYVLPNGVTNPNVTSYTVEIETITLQDFSHDDYTFEGWFDAETGGNKVTSIPKGSTGNKTLYAHCTWKWIGTKNPTTAKAVGDIVFSDGSATAYSTDLTLSDAQKEAAVAVIFYAGSASDTLGAKTLGVGLKNTGTDSTLQWARYTSSDDKAEGYSTNITAIQCTSSEMGSGKAATATFTGDTDGSDNWQALCAAVSDEGTSGNYPAWEWVNAYATPATANLTGSYANGWYLPTVAELSMLYRAKDTVNSALEKAGGTKITDNSYWSSSQYASNDYYAWGVWFDDGNLYDGYKDSHKSVCTVRAF